MVPQHTLKAGFARQGVGLHTGAPCQVCVEPAPPHTGRYFVCMDQEQQPIHAQVERVGPTQLCTVLQAGSAQVATVEHLLAALVGLGIDNARIEVQGPEVPLLDGSALEWAQAIEAAGRVSQAFPRAEVHLAESVTVQDGEAFVCAVPAPRLCFTYGIDFPHLPAIGQQWYTWNPEREPFVTAIAPARTFGFAAEIEHLQAQGLIRGGSLDNALVCSAQGWLNPPLRFADEPVRHKLLDLVGDLSLVGVLPIAHYLAYKAGHRLHVQLARHLRTLVSPLESAHASG